MSFSPNYYRNIWKRAIRIPLYMFLVRAAGAKISMVRSNVFARSNGSEQQDFPNRAIRKIVFALSSHCFSFQLPTKLKTSYEFAIWRLRQEAEASTSIQKLVGHGGLQQPTHLELGHHLEVHEIAGLCLRVHLSSHIFLPSCGNPHSPFHVQMERLVSRARYPHEHPKSTCSGDIYRCGSHSKELRTRGSMCDLSRRHDHQADGTANLRPYLLQYLHSN